MKQIKKKFDAPALITLEGNVAFRFVHKEQERATYLVAGFESGDKLVHVIDYRQAGLHAIDCVIETGNDALFAKEFSAPAWVTITESENGVEIKLLDLDSDIDPELMLWIATGIEEPIPDYEYLFLLIEPFWENSYSLVSIFNYQRFQAYFDNIAVDHLVEN